MKELGNGVAPAPDFGDRFRKFSLPEKNGSLRTRVHHQDVGTKLLERPGKFIALGVSIDKVEELEVTLSVADNAVEIVDLKKTEITMVILDAFLLKLGALFGSELIILATRGGTGGAKLMISEKRFATVRTIAVRPAGQFHLQHTEVDPELQFLPTVQSEDFPHFDGAVLMRPILQNGIQIQAHPEQMIEHLVFNCQSWRVDAWDASKRRWKLGGGRSEDAGSMEQRARSEDRTFHWSLVTYHS